MAIKQPLGEAYVDVIARLDKLEKSLAEGKTKTDKAAKKMEGSFAMLSKKIGGARSTLNSFRAGVVALAGLGGFGLAIKRNLDFLDSLDKVSRKLGISTDFLQQVQYAASQSGIAFETVGMAMQRFVRRAGEASTGTGEAKDAIKELGIQLRDTSGRIRSSEDLFSQAMKALADIQDPATRLRLAFKLFDSEGAVLVNLVDRFESLTDSARKLGLVIDDAVIERGVRAKDKLDTFAKVIRAELLPSLVDLSPALIDIGRVLIYAAQSAASAWMWFSDILNLTPHTLEQARDRVGELKRDISELVGKIELLKPIRLTGREGWQTVKELEEDLKSKRAELEILQKQVARLEEIMAPTEPPKVQALIPPKLTAEQETSLQRQLDMIQTIKIEWLNATGQRVEAIEAERDAAIKALDEQLLGEEKYQAARTQLYDIAAEKIEDVNEEAAEKLKNLNEKGTFDLASEWESLSSSASASLAQMVADGELSFKALGQAFVREFMQRILQELVFNRIFSALSLTFGSFSGGGGGGGAASLGAGAIGAGLQSNATTVPSGLASINAAVTPQIAMSSNVQIINATGAPVQTQQLGDGDVRVFIGQQGAKDLAAGGALAQALETRYGLSARGVRR